MKSGILRDEMFFDPLKAFIVAVKPPVHPGQTFLDRGGSYLDVVQIAGDIIQLIPHLPEKFQNDVAVTRHCPIIAPFPCQRHNRSAALVSAGVNLKLNSLLRLYSRAKGMLDLRHFRHQIGDLD